MRTGVLLVLGLFTCVEAHAQSDPITMQNRRDSLREIAFNGLGTTTFIEAPYKIESPSLTIVSLWQTNTLPYRGNRSSIQQVKVDCGVKKFATVQSTYFERTFWLGDSHERAEASDALYWRPLSETYTEVQKICAPENDPVKNLGGFDPPEVAVKIH